MKMNSSLTAMIRVASLLLGVTLCTSVPAQTMFRCGSTYQDRPCDEGKPSKTLTSSRSTQSPVSGGTDAFCSQRGAVAQKIVWAREGGAMLEQQLAKSRNGEERKLIADVYQKRGTSAEVRAAIESECTIEQEKAARLAALVGTSKPPTPTSDAVGNGRPGIEGEQKMAGDSRTNENAKLEAANKKALCENLNETLANIRDAQRAGGSAATMDTLHRNKTAAEKKLTQSRC